MTATDTKQAKLARLHNRATLYELSMTNGSTSYLVCYTNRKGRSGIWNAVTDKARVDHITRLTGTENIHFAKRSADGATMGEWTINFTGRTQRQAICEGELPYVAG